MKTIFSKFTLLASTLALCLLAVTSCREYLEVQPKSQISLDDAFSNLPNATNAVLGVYDELMGDNGYGIRINMYYPYDSDEIIVSGNLDNGRRGIGRYQLLLTNTEIRNPFLQLYRGVEKANLCIEQLPKMALYTNGTDAEKKELRRLHGEALTLRAQFYFELMRNWGDVPAPMQPSYTQANLFIPQSNRDDTYAKLIDDLKTATDLVPWRSEVAVRNERITKGAVKALRAKMALFRGGYALRSSGQMERNADYLTYYKIARDECADLMAKRGEHTLNPSYEDIWRKVTSFQYDPAGEIIFEAGAGGANSTSDSRMGNYNGPVVNASSRYGTGGGGLVVLPNYFYAFDSTDVRRDVTVTLYSVAATNIKAPRRLGELTDGKFRKDWRVPLLPGTALNPGYNWPFIRFADVLLMFAEAENELTGPTPAAIAAFEEVRKRAFPKGSAAVGTTPATKAAFFDALVNERYLEFGSEGIRKFDLIRWNLLAQKIAETRQKLIQLRDATGPYANVPRYLFWKNNGEEIQWGNSFYKPTALTTAPTGFTRLDWRQHLTTNIIDGLQLDAAIARFFVAGKSELFPFDQATVDAYQGKIKQNPGY
ncbi:RagB/SusD domain protein [Fibrella aestuarina BUZ 2]|uniref:RagB/SusD domain protein n=1 Tax=Fibrella aestuarina BUZ 2 TaxID=1166018 RepID=I0KC72_9BACT|nr:RagB/SusD family nutrient uptake outer membrane protein [Fibrella aestuarina]CCH01725.1 RagB/SusD domain protein [Fibrella aestuarina BUZ 2]